MIVRITEVDICYQIASKAACSHAYAYCGCLFVKSISRCIMPRVDAHAFASVVFPVPYAPYNSIQTALLADTTRSLIPVKICYVV
jgi:hypothetical protein